MSSEIKAKYKGSGFHHGIPARDLTASDWARLTAEQQKLVELSSMYELVGSKKPAKKKEGD